MYMSEISKSKVSGLKAQKMIILLTLKHVSAISEHPVLQEHTFNKCFSLQGQSLSFRCVECLGLWWFLSCSASSTNI